MMGSVAKHLRQQATQAARQTAEAVTPDILVTYQNEKITRGRVDAIEAVLGRSLWGRLRWLLFGR